MWGGLGTPGSRGGSVSNALAVWRTPRGRESRLEVAHQKLGHFFRKVWVGEPLRLVEGRAVDQGFDGANRDEAPLNQSECRSRSAPTIDTLFGKYW